MEEEITKQDLFDQLRRVSNEYDIPHHLEEQIANAIAINDFNYAEHLLKEIERNKNIWHQDENIRKLKEYDKQKTKFELEINKLKEELIFRNTDNKSLQHHCNKLENLVDNTRDENEKLKQELNNLKTAKQQQRIEDKIPEYVKEISETLNSDDCLFMNKSQRWSQVGVIVSALAVILSIASFIVGYIELAKPENLTFTIVIFVFFRGLLGVGILTWVAYFCFKMSSSYIHESILRKDRQHALSFGKVFLQIYGDTATKQEAIEVFKDWNMSGDSAFSKMNTLPPNINQLIDFITNKYSEEQKNSKSIK